jgi:curved DNA-binding protein CbpA
MHGPRTCRPQLILRRLCSSSPFHRVDDDATDQEIKKAYRSLAKQCHPDFLGDRGHEICIMLNEAYQVLSDPDARAAYNTKLEQALLDEDDNYTGEPLSRWIPTKKPAMVSCSPAAYATSCQSGLPTASWAALSAC